MTFSVCIVQNKVPIDDKTFRFLLQFSPPEKRERILRQRIKQNANNMAVGGALVRHMLWEKFRIPVNASISYGKFGKPYLPDYPGTHFNISHSGTFVACAACDQPVGVDIQEITAYQPDVAARVCSLKERLQIEVSADPTTEFTKIWTMKEARVKAMGLGIWNHLQNDSFGMGGIICKRIESTILSISIVDSLEYKDLINADKLHWAEVGICRYL